MEHSEGDAICSIGNTNISYVLFEAVGLDLFATDEVSTSRAGGRLI
jgi:hypothetical protein